MFLGLIESGDLQVGVVLSEDNPESFPLSVQSPTFRLPFELTQTRGISVLRLAVRPVSVLDAIL